MIKFIIRNNECYLLEVCSFLKGNRKSRYRKDGNFMGWGDSGKSGGKGNSGLWSGCVV